MLRNALLAGAAVLAMIPAIGSAQTAAGSSAVDAAQSPSQTSGVATPGGSTTPYSSQAPSSSDTAVSPPGANSPDSAPPLPSSAAPQDQSQGANPAPGYYSSSPSDQAAPDTSQPAQPAPDQAAPPSPGVDQSQPSASESVQPQASNTAESDHALVVVPKVKISSKEYVRRAAMADNYEVRAAQIAQRRAQSDTTRQFANDMMQQHTQSTAILTQAASQAGVPVDNSLDRSHRAMLRRLERTPAAEFDHVYLHQQLTAHMNAAALHQGYAQNGDNPTLQQAAQQITPIVQQHMNVAWNDSGLADRMAEQRNNELNQVAENNRGSTYRGYTVIGPTSVKQLHKRSHHHHHTGATTNTGANENSSGGGSASTGETSSQTSSMTGVSGGAAATPQYQGYSATSSATDYAAAQPSPGAGGATGGATGAVPGAASPGAPAASAPGAPQSPGYGGYTTSQPSTGAASPGTTTGTTNPNVTGTPQYQGYTSGAPGSAAPGAYPSTTTPGTTSPNAVTPGTTAPNAATPGTASPQSSSPQSSSPQGSPPQG